jgi:tRNA-splicing ligase RtcB
MDTSQFTRHSQTEWYIKPFGRMRAPAIIYATEELIRDMDQKVFESLMSRYCRGS